LFLDGETTGLLPHDSRLLEIGMVAVELPTFEPVDMASFVFRFDLVEMQKAGLYVHPKVIDMHTKNNLWHDCACSPLDDYQKMDEMVQRFIVDAGCQGSVLGGANPDFDRRFLTKFLPGTNNVLHYRNFDNNTFWLLQEFITGEKGTREKPAAHRAIDDCMDAIAVVEKHFEFMKTFWERVAA
jgi:oligoribonuclease (3'-5' exoribonuclease)